MMRMMRVSLHAAIVTVMLAAAAAGTASTAAAQSWPAADDASAKVRLAESSRHGEYVDIAVPGRATPLRAFVVYPEIATKAPVVIVLPETAGLTDWIRGVTDQLAADGFIAIAPDLLTGKAAESDPALIAVRGYGAKLPAATGQTATLTLPATPSFDGQSWAATLSSLRQKSR